MTSFSPWRLPLLSAAALATALCLGMPRRAAAVCVGDCNGDGRVSIADVQACVNLGSGLPGPACAAADQDGDGTVEPNDVDACLQSFLDASTCPMVFTPVPTRTATAPPPATATATRPPATPTNTVPPPPTFTNTPVSTNTPIPTSTPVPTATPAPILEHVCALDTSPPSDSQLFLYIAALPVALTADLSGSVKFSAVPGGGSASCEITALTPINLPSIGFICITPGAPCADGMRTCAGGPPLGINVTSDGLGGTCISNDSCAAIAATACGGAANVQSSACVGFCSLGTEAACTSDAACLPSNGACNGPNPVAAAQKNTCQYSCLNTAAHGPSAAGELQCNLGARLVVENAPPCDGTDIRINVGNSCVPFSTQRASSAVVDANFSPGATVPLAPAVNSLDGSEIACSALDASTTTGMVAVGAVNFFGSTLGDIASGLRVTCQ